MLERVLGIDLGDHERHLVVHAPVSGVIDDDAARRREHGGVYAAGFAARAHDDDLRAHFLDVLFVGLEHGVFLALPDDRAARALGGREGIEFTHGELALGKHLEHLSSDHSGRTYDRNFEFFHYFLRKSIRDIDRQNKKALPKRVRQGALIRAYAFNALRGRYPRQSQSCWSLRPTARLRKRRATSATMPFHARRPLRRGNAAVATDARRSSSKSYQDNIIYKLSCQADFACFFAIFCDITIK